MATSDIRLTILQIVNEVQRRLGVTPTATLTATKQATMLLDLLNDVIDEVSDFGDWQELFRETTVTASSSLGEYEIAVSAPVKNIYEIVYDNNTAPLNVVEIQDIRRLQRLASYGVPRQFAVVGVSGVNPKFRVYPIPTTAATFDIAYYVKPRIYTTSDAAVLPTFPGRMLVMGVYAKALLEENGGESGPQYTVAYAEYMRMRQEAANRLTADTGTDIYMVPTGR